MDDRLSALIGRIYEGAADPAAFRDAVDRLLVHVDAHLGLIVAADTLDATVSGITFVGATRSAHADAAADYHGDLWRTDPTMIHFVTHPGARFFDTALHRPAAAHAADPYVAWNRDRFGSTHWMACHAQRDTGQSFGLSLHANDPHRAFTARERDEFRLLFEHFERAQWLATRPPDLSHRDDAIVMLDRRCRVCAASRAGDAALVSGDGLVVRDGVLTTADPRQARALDQLLASALGAVSGGGVGGELRLHRPGGGPALVVLVDPLPDQAQLGSVARGALVRIVDAGLPATAHAVARWRGLWRLSPAETRAAAALVAHEFDLRAAADATGITYATMRTQLAALYAKTDTASQPALMRLLMRVAG